MPGYPEEEQVGGDGTAAPTVADLSLANIERASAVIPAVFLNTPQFENEALNAVLGCCLTVKIESLNPIASFKARGAYAFVSPLAGRPHLVCATAGNFGQGLAHAARAHGLAITIFTSADIPPLKLQRMQWLGADVRPVCRSGEEALDAAAAFAIENLRRLHQWRTGHAALIPCRPRRHFIQSGHDCRGPCREPPLPRVRHPTCPMGR